MMKTSILHWFLVIAFALSSCAIEVGQPAIQPPAPTPATIPTLAPTEESSRQTNKVTKTQIEVTWDSLNLTGRLVYTNGTLVDGMFGLQIQILDLETGDVTTIFDAPKYSWIYYIAISPDKTELLMSYSPPPGDNPVDQDIYVMPLDGSQPPKVFFTPPQKEDDYIEVEWAPDGKYVYMTHVNYQIPPEEGQVYPFYTIYRMEYPDGQLEKVVEKAYWPRISPDSSKITYVSVDLFKSGNNLFMANVDGSNPQEVSITSPRIPDIRDAPMFSPDGKSIFFSAPLPTQSYQPSLLDKLMGVQVAKAHSGVASDWWAVPLSGGVMTQLTNIQATSLFGSFSPDGKHIASHSLTGIFVMKSDGSELTMLIPNPQSVPGTVVWIP